MSTKSFETDLVLKTDEALQNFLDAILEANRRGPVEFPDAMAELAKGKASIPERCPF